MIFLWFVALGVAVLASAFYSGVETGAYCVNRTRLQVALDEKRPRAAAVSALVNSMPITIATILVGNNLANYAAAALVTGYFERMGYHHAGLLATVVLAPVLFVFAEVTPKTIYARHADTLFYTTAPILRLSEIVFRPATAVLGLVTGFWRRILGAPDLPAELRLTDRRLRFLLQAGTREGVLTKYQHTLAENVMALRNITVERVMVRWDQVARLPADDLVGRARQVAAEKGFSRYPVVDRSGANAGVVHILDLFLDAEETDPVRRWAHDVPAFGPSAPVLNALYELQRHRSPLGIVREADGSPVGIVTVKDLVEEICGELVVW